MNKLVAFTAAILMATSAHAKDNVNKQKHFDMMVNNHNQIYNTLDSWGYSEEDTVSLSTMITNYGYGWDFSLGEASNWTPDENIGLGQWHTNSVQNQWDKGWTGKGVTIIIKDRFSGNRSSFVAGANYHPEGKMIRHRDHHGNAVAMVAGGIHDVEFQEREHIDGSWTTTGTFQKTEYGVAPEATIHKYDNNYTGATFVGIDIVNISRGHGSKNNKQNGQHLWYQNWFNNMSNLDDEKGTLIITSAGNKSMNSHHDSVNNAVVYGKYAESGLVVGALSWNDNSKLSAYSNKAGNHKYNFVVEKGVMRNSDMVQYGGTSFAAPIVAGKAALIMQKYPGLNATKVAKLIKFTADDLGEPGVDSTYGYGRVNLNKAMSPFGDIN